MLFVCAINTLKDSFFEFTESGIIFGISALILHEFPKPLYQIEIRRIRGQKQQLDIK